MNVAPRTQNGAAASVIVASPRRRPPGSATPDVEKVARATLGWTSAAARARVPSARSAKENVDKRLEFIKGDLERAVTSRSPVKGLSQEAGDK